MITIYEKEIIGEEGAYYVECEEAEATHIHTCYNDETPSRECKRVPK